MNQGIIVAILSILFYITSLFGGGAPQTPAPTNLMPPVSQEHISSITGQRAEIIGDRVTIRSGPSSDHPAISSLEKGTKVTLLRAENGWYQIRYTPGENGWIAGYLVELLPNDLIEKQNSTGKTVLGYYLLGSQSYESMLDNGDTLTSIAPWSWGVDSSGGLNADFDPEDMGEVLLFAGNHGLETYALIHNMQNNSFDSKTATNLLNNPIARERAVENIYNTLVNWGVKGVNIDLETIPPEDRDALTSFVAQLAAKLETAGLKTTIAVPAKTVDDLTNSHSGAFDYAALAEHVDFMVIMAYDQHYRKGEAGPIASADWVEDVIQFAVSQVPKNKIVLGIPGYGYDWPASGWASAVTYQQAMELAAKEGVSVRWHSDYKVPYFNYGSGNEVWFENRYSIKYKLDLVEKYDLQGIALWRLGQEDPEIWSAIEKVF